MAGIHVTLFITDSGDTLWIIQKDIELICQHASKPEVGDATAKDGLQGGNNNNNNRTNNINKQILFYFRLMYINHRCKSTLPLSIAGFISFH